MKDNTIDYLVPPSNIQCSQWENIDSRYHGVCKAGLYGGAPSKGTCMLKCDNFLSENPKFDRQQYAADLTLYGYRVFEYPGTGLGDYVHWIIKVLTLGLVPMCAACSRRRALLNRWWFNMFRKLTGAGYVGLDPEDKLYRWKPDAVPPPNAVDGEDKGMSQMSQFRGVDDPVREPEKCSPCEARRKAEEARRKKEQEQNNDS